MARRIVEHEHRDRIVALLLRKFFEAPAPEEADPPAAQPGGGFRDGGAPPHGRPRRRGRGRH